MMRRWIALLITLLALLISRASRSETTDAQSLIDRGQWRRARATLEPYVASHPNDARAAVQLSQVLARAGELDPALKLAEKAVALEPKRAEAHLQLSEIAGEKAQRAGGLSAMGMAKRFKREAEATLALDPNHVDARFSLMVFHLKAPGIVGGDKKKAVVLREEIAKLDPETGCYARARYALETKDTTQIETFYARAVEIAPNSVKARLTLASWYAAPWRKAALAEQQALEALKLDPSHTETYTLLAGLYARAARWSELEAVLEKADAHSPENLGAWYQAGRATLVGGQDFPRAERYLRRYLTHEPELGWPDAAAAHWRIAQALEKQGKRDAALAELQTALKMRPEFEEAKKDLKRMRG